MNNKYFFMSEILQGIGKNLARYKSTFHLLLLHWYLIILRKNLRFEKENDLQGFAIIRKIKSRREKRFDNENFFEVTFVRFDFSKRIGSSFRIQPIYLVPEDEHAMHCTKNCENRISHWVILATYEHYRFHYNDKMHASIK